MPGTVLCAGATTVNRTERKKKHLHLSEADILEKKGTNKKISKYVFKYIVPYIVKHIVIICNNYTYETYITTTIFYGAGIVLSVSYIFPHSALRNIVL